MFDINQMLRDILLFGSPSAEQDLRSLEGHGSSLFSILKDRDCSQAEIESRFCACTNNVIKLNGTDSNIISLAENILESKERTIIGTGYCQPYRLDRVQSVKLISEGLTKTIEMQLYLKNDGVVFDVSLTFEESKIQRLEMIRMDWYSSTSTCLPHQLDFIKQYCICQ